MCQTLDLLNHLSNLLLSLILKLKLCLFTECAGVSVCMYVGRSVVVRGRFFPFAMQVLGTKL